jgi:periplasmic protein TonB
MKNIFLLLTLFVATNSFAQEVKDTVSTKNSIEEKIICQKLQIEAEFVGGQKALDSFLQNNLQNDVPVKNGAKPGIYRSIVRFVVNIDGTLEDFVIELDPGYGTNEEVLRIMKKSPKWKPGLQNGYKVNSIKRLLIVFITK